MIDHKNKSQTGRSMIEMLGVLAIFGILTLGAFSGYRYSINKQRANDVVNMVSNMAISASSQIDLRKQFNLYEFSEDPSKLPIIVGLYPVEPSPYTGDETFTISVLELPKRVCQDILDIGWKLPHEIRINDGTTGCEDIEGGNKMSFKFLCSWI